MTIGEIRKGIENLKDSERKEKVRIWLEHELHDWFHHRILPIDERVADRCGRLESEMKRPLSAIDSLIAAIALASRFTVSYTKY